MKDFVAESGYPVSEGREFLATLNEFYYNVCLEIQGEEKPGALEFSLASDINMFMGNLLIETFPNLKWMFHTFGKTNVNYQSPVIMGFTNVRNTKYAREFFLPIGAYVHRTVKGGSREDDLFVKLYDSCVRYA